MTLVNSTFVLPSGSAPTNAKITFTPTSLRRSGASSILIPQSIERPIVAGAASADLVPGAYLVRIESDWLNESYPITVPTTGPVDLIDLIEWP